MSNSSYLTGLEGGKRTKSSLVVCLEFMVFLTAYVYVLELVVHQCRPRDESSSAYCCLCNALLLCLLQTHLQPGELEYSG